MYGEIYVRCERDGRIHPESQELMCNTCRSEFVESVGQGIESFISSDDENLSSNFIDTDTLVQGLVNRIVTTGEIQLSPLISAAQQTTRGNRPIGLVLRQSTYHSDIQLGRYDGHYDNRLGSSFEDLLHHLFINEPSHSLTSPASHTVIQQLERRTENLSELGDCSISQEPFSDSDVAVILPCGHAYRESLILQWLNIQNTCPVCRISL